MYGVAIAFGNPFQHARFVELTTINFADKRDFIQRPHERHFICDHEFRSLDWTTLERDTHRLAELFDDVDRDALECAFPPRRRCHLPIAHHEQTGSDRLCHTTMLIQQHHLGIASRPAFNLGEAGHLVVAAGLDASRHCIVGPALPSTDARRNGRGHVQDVICRENEIGFGPLPPMSLFYVKRRAGPHASPRFIHRLNE